MRRWGWVSKISKQLTRKWLHSLLLVSLLSGLLPVSSTLAVDANDKMQPLLRQLASEEPALMVDLIVQHRANRTNLTPLITKLGRKITRELSLIRALAIKLPISQAATLARQPDVRWISLDSQLYKSSIAESEGSVILREEFNHEFVSPAAMGWHGLGAWSGQAWQEIGETDGAASGDVAVTRFFGGALEGLRLQNSERGLIGLATLGETTSSTLSYAYRRKDFDDSSDYVTIEISTDEGASWTEVDRQSGPATDDKSDTIVVEVSKNGGAAYTILETLTGITGNHYNNGGSVSGILYPPANDPFVITVGAADDRGTVAITDDLIPAFSAYGTTTEGFAKPDLVAPGRNIISLLASDDSNLALAHPANTVPGYLGAHYFRMSGTSMASAVAAGAVALLLQDEPNLTPDQVKYRLKATANKNWSGYNAQKTGAGYLDIYAAVYGTTIQSANTGIAASQLLWSGSQPLTWGSVSWNTVSWNTVSWNTVSWNTVSWE